MPSSSRRLSTRCFAGTRTLSNAMFTYLSDVSTKNGRQITRWQSILGSQHFGQVNGLHDQELVAPTWRTRTRSNWCYPSCSCWSFVSEGRLWREQADLRVHQGAFVSLTIWLITSISYQANHAIDQQENPTIFSLMPKLLPVLLQYYLAIQSSNSTLRPVTRWSPRSSSSLARARIWFKEMRFYWIAYECRLLSISRSIHVGGFDNFTSALHSWMQWLMDRWR